MKGITDIHSHILFGVDDGADTIDDSIEILKQEYEQGVSNVILTPHYHMGRFMPRRTTILEHYEEIKKIAKEKIPNINIYLGNEILSCNEIVDKLDRERLFTLAGSNYVLVEFSVSAEYEEVENRIKEILNGGYIPIIAHCERYRCFRMAFNKVHLFKIRHLVEMGAYMQVNVSAVYKRDKNFVYKLLDYDLVHFIASDVHNTTNRGAHWDKCIKQLEKRYNDEFIQRILKENPKKILNGEYV